MRSFLSAALLFLLSALGASAQETVTRPIGNHSVILSNAANNNRLWGWIELQRPKGETGYAGYVYLRPDGVALDAPRLGGTGTEAYVIMDAPISQAELLLRLLETQTPMQIRLQNGEVYLERVWQNGVAPPSAEPAMRKTEMRGELVRMRAGAPQVRLANWNIQTLTIPGERVFKNTKDEELRTPADFTRLQKVRDAVGADVFVLQEISSLKALAMVFPTSEWQLCFSGQYAADEVGLGPYYDSDDVGEIVPTCVTDTDDTKLPDPPVGQLRKQYLAFAVKKTSGISIEAVRDLSNLAVAAEDRNTETNTVEVRSVRWGFEATLGTPGGSLRVLNVHMKSGCFDGFLRSKWWKDLAAWAPDGEVDHACDTLARQLPALRGWIADAGASEKPFVIIGDFNRRLDVEDEDTKSPDMLPVLNGTATSDDGSDDTALSYVPEGQAAVKACWPEEDQTDRRHSIEFMMFGPGDRPDDWEASYAKLRYVDMAQIGGSSLVQETDSPHLSDHCPSVISLR
ncbi:hypothetical protein NKI48_25845 [Mesorhizobium sp. M0644]|uniref:endonuclease/exonuclease/phosphatase family protein n=1 Tax=unclassified Mesorhizobium TaxID=325217 RepID=UPI003338F2A5